LVGLALAKLAHAFARRDCAHCHHLREINFDGAIQLQLFKQAFAGIARRITVLELKVAERRLKSLVIQPAMMIR
jgi:hypothetical protein